MKRLSIAGILFVFSLLVTACDKQEEAKINERDAQAMESKKRAKAASDYYFGKTKERPQYSDDK